MMPVSASEDSDLALAGELLADGPRSELVREWIAFDSSPSRLMPDSHWPSALPREDRDLIMNSPLARRFLDRHVLADVRQSGQVPWQPENPSWKLAMMPESLLTRSLVLAAFCSAADLLRSTVQGRILKALRDAFGRAYLDYISLRHSSRRFTPPSDYGISQWSAEPVEDILTAARQAASRCFSESDEAIRVRMGYKLSTLLKGSALERGSDDGMSEFVISLSKAAAGLPEPVLP